ncbi:MAG: DNA/RNA non-specific endonuclease [Proteobacteria bacterium]|nr:DNA/RNA non-specific endonuclease [Pseudomonadota bacterium]
MYITSKIKPLVLALVLLLGMLAAPAAPQAAGCAWIYAGVGKPLNNTTSNNPTGGNTELCRKAFLLSFNQTTGVADWVMERLSASALSGDADRSFSHFKSDPDLAGGPALSDYRGSGYDRGHLAPAADMKWDQRAMDQSFYLSNIAPQVGAGFNRGIWARLEAKIRGWTRTKGDIIVITGPVYYDYRPVIGGRVVVPDAYFKIIYAPADGRALAFLMPNRRITAPALTPHQVTIDALEVLTGYDFFNTLPVTLEDRLESETGPLWP